jgi:hypothetical protein
LLFGCEMYFQYAKNVNVATQEALAGDEVQPIFTNRTVCRIRYQQGAYPKCG